jgi:hypothetical protein
MQFKLSRKTDIIDAVIRSCPLNTMIRCPERWNKGARGALLLLMAKIGPG